MKDLIFLLEDDKSICELVKMALQNVSLDCETYCDVKSFMLAISSKNPSVAILDVMLPDGNGFDVLQDLKRQYPQIPCIMLSALGKETDKVKGLNLGADDYIAKPFGIMELIARINVVLRHKKTPSVIKINNAELNSSTMELLINGERIELKSTEFQLAKYFFENPNVVLSREKILQAVWGYDTGQSRTLDNYVVRLRKYGLENIVTVFGTGYKLVSEG